MRTACILFFVAAFATTVAAEPPKVSDGPAALLVWEGETEAQQALRCQVDSSRQRLTIVRPSPQGAVTLVELEPSAFFVGMFPTREGGGNLITIWATANAYYVHVFAVVGGNVTTVLNAGTRLLPEILYVGQDPEPALVISTGVVLEDAGPRPSTADIYRWRGGRYVLDRTVPWDKRLDVIAKLS
jgi:hypothetical protein